MAYTSEIDKLEARFRENPKGRNFAPLADAYRKAGLIDNAVELCQTGLKLHPDYVSAHIVYGRCLIDKKDDAGATEVFAKVLGLDPENIIALRVLSEIAERNGRFDQAVEWLTRLLSADPMNGDAAEALARAKGKAASAKPAIADAPAVAMNAEFVVEHTSLAADATPTASAAQPSPDVETFDGTLTVNPAAHAAAKAEGLEVQEDVELNAQQIERVEVEGLAPTQYEGRGMFKLDAPPPPDVPEAADESPHIDLPLIMPDDASPRRTPPAPLRPPPAPSPPRVPAAVTLSDDDGAADTATLAQAEPVLTETMAELYLKQGHQEDALRVYQALLAQRPGDARLRGKIEQMSSGGRRRSGISAQAFLKGLLSGRGAPAPEPPPAAPSTLDAAFEAAGPPPGEPTYPAADNISLDSVFGGGGDAGRAVPPPPP
ncbi:MAG TPA: tetratricopeptide repeat protein, partial [Gemmatimonadales bacterium]|nr:tetratricopeptide repeat protein [Gemmatimonadales bacterium]